MVLAIFKHPLLLFTSKEKIRKIVGLIEEIEQEISVKLKVIEIPEMDNIEELKKKLTELEFEGRFSSM